MKTPFGAFLPLAALMLAVTGVCAQPRGNPAPYKRMLDDALQFTGHTDPTVDPRRLDSIAIGLFAPSKLTDSAARDLIQGAELAVETANSEGGYHGVPFRLVRRWAENPWSGGAKELISLAYEDKVWAVIGFLKGISNIAQQIATKAYLPVVSPVASDSSLTRARVPWIFRLPPDDRTQAQSLVTDGIRARGMKQIGLLTSLDHDGRMAAAEFLREMEQQGMAPVFHLPIAPNVTDIGPVVQHVLQFSPDGLLMHLPRDLIVRMLKEMQQRNAAWPVLLPWIPGLDVVAARSVYRGIIITIEPFDISKTYRLHPKFLQSYTRHFGAVPTAGAAYAYDAALMIIMAIRNNGLTRSGVRAGLAALSGYEGATGRILWDNGGGNQAQPIVCVFPK